MTPVSAPHLFALAHGKACAGPHRCWYCAAPCAEQFPISEWVKSSFTSRDSVPAASPWICEGCVLCLRESCEITTADGKQRTGQKTRGYSWIVTATKAQAATKADLQWLRDSCLDPPEPPFAVVLSDSGQKHLLYRGVVCHSRDYLSVTLEGERVNYAPFELAARLELAGRICAASGKPALTEPVTVRLAMAVLDRYPDGEALITQWEAVYGQSLSRLAAWLCPNREQCESLYPAPAPSGL